MNRKIDFPRIAQAALSRWNTLLPSWIPGGKVSGHEYFGLNPTRSDRHKGSFAVNINTGQWGDFSTGEKGGDFISLYAYLHSVRQKDAAIALAEIVGISDDVPANNNHAPAEPEGKPDSRKKSPWTPVLPVPQDAPKPPRAHVKRGIPDYVYRYLDADGLLIGYIYRFKTSTGGKETIPLSFCRNADTGDLQWRWVSFSEPRPIYKLDRLAKYPDRPVLLVEGEKCVDFAEPVIEGNFVVVSWPGGSKAIGKVDWSPLAGRSIYAWADCDSKREPLSKDDKANGVDPLTKPLLPESKQPGMRAMRDICRMLKDIDPDTDFKFVNIPKPGDKPDGWDVADAIDDGAQMNDLIAMINDVRTDKQQPKQQKQDGGLLMSNGRIVPCLSNIYDIISADINWRGVLAFNEFSYVICKRNKPPFTSSDSEEWDANDDVQTAMWLTRNYAFAPSPAQVAEAVEALARANTFHPVRDYLNSLEWDGQSRVDDWITDYIGAPKNDYIMRVSRWFLMGMVARVMEPGVKFDCCLVLEGAQGRRKSSMLRALAGEWFGDTDLDLHNKDSMNSIRGKWLYEFAELDSLARAEAARQKSFLSRQVDEFRPPYGRRDIRSPRQLVFGGSTNEWSWNKDTTGGRRFWPVVCDQEIDCEGLAAVRDQLFAEAYHLYKKGKRFWPTSEEQRTIFDPEQVKRHQHDSFIDMLEKYVEEQYDLFSMADAAYYLKIDPARLSRDVQTRIGKALQALGCTKKEKKTNAVSRFWYKPPERSEAGSSTGDSNGGERDIPF
ncbi:VapE domain-containing protein [Nitrosomonas marina]|uniref:Predicted P-loop ATPase and inactivated derivatives n=1 Tax=Nitrosomonas marina TaxID=917 RepID=A0A1H8GI11_9PROT|nr:VapE domain-containing protein [Nitrosomonas marina]SEN43791.1 Predicted P-loop ATPase and inactivated derivatives [Nitrosomonas marina]